MSHLAYCSLVYLMGVFSILSIAGAGFTLWTLHEIFMSLIHKNRFSKEAWKADMSFGLRLLGILLVVTILFWSCAVLTIRQTMLYNIVEAQECLKM